MNNRTEEQQDSPTEERCTNEKYITISVDDGHPLDLRTAELLDKYGLKGTFYIPGLNDERTLMTPSQMRESDRQFEVGSHCLNHVRLTWMPVERSWREISDGKKFSEDALGHEVISFCYPGGKFNERIESQVKKAGFLSARTCRYFLYDFPEDPFRWGVSVYANTYPSYVQVRHALMERNFQGCYNYLTTFRAQTRWGAQFQYALEKVSSKGGVAHLYLHSWEIDENREWDELERVFKAIRQYSLTPVTNGYLSRLWHEKQALLSVPIPA